MTNITLDTKKVVAFLLTDRGTETQRYLFPDYVTLTGQSLQTFDRLSSLELAYLGPDGFERHAVLRYGHDYTLYGVQPVRLSFKLDSTHMRTTHELPGTSPRLWCLSLVDNPPVA